MSKRFVIRLMLLAAAFCKAQRCCQGAAIYYDVADWNQYNGSLNPSYLGTGSHVAASTLFATNGLTTSNFSDEEGNGKFWFDGWATSSSQPNGPSIQFSITPDVPIQPTTLTYTWFRGIWSNLWSSPPNLDIYASFDNFATEALVASHDSGAFLLPWQDGSPTYADSLLSLGDVAPGQTLSFRFVAWGEAPSNSGTPTGFYDAFPDQSDLILEVTPLPEPTSVSILSLGLLALTRRPKRTNR